MSENTKLDKARNAFLNNIGFIIVLVVATVYIARSILKIEDTGKSVVEILADGAFALIFGWFVKSLLGEQGILSGLNCKAMNDTLGQHGNAVTAIEKFMPKLPDFCLMKNAKLRIEKRKHIIGRKNLNYDDVFCDDPQRLEKVIEDRLAMFNSSNTSIKVSTFKKMRERWLKWKERRSILKCVAKANKIKITELSSDTLTSDGGDSTDPYNFGPTIKQYTAKSTASKLGTAVMFAVVFGYLGVSMVDDFSWATLVWAIFQMLAFVVSGVWSFLTSYIHIIDSYRKGIVRKINILKEFETLVKDNGGRFVIPDEIIKTNKEAINNANK